MKHLYKYYIYFKPYFPQKLINYSTHTCKTRYLPMVVNNCSKCVGDPNEKYGVLYFLSPFYFIFLG